MELLPVVPVVVGAALAGLFALLGAWIQGRREHARWLRERRYESFARVQTLVMEMSVLELEHETVLAVIDELKTHGTPIPQRERDRAHNNVARLAELKAEQASVGGPLAVLGPPAVEQAFGRLMDDWDDADLKAAAARSLVREMRSALRIRR